MSLLNKLSKKLRWLRWSTVFAIVFYMFFIGLILHSTTYKLQQSLKNPPNTQQHQQQQNFMQHYSLEWSEKWRAQHATGNKVVPASDIDTKKAMASSSSSSSSSSSTSHSASSLSASLSLTAAAAGALAAPSKSLKVDGGNVGKQQKKNSVSSPETVILVASSASEKQILEKAFKRADRNHDNYLTIKELGQYINKNIVDHIDEAIQLNPREFRRVDIAPADGLITWEEYHRFFLKEHGMTEADIDEHNEIKHTALNRKAREDMMRDKARWSEAARTDLFTLTIDEYLSFRHPESSISNLLELVDDLLRQFDQDGDDQLSIEEFSEVNVADDDDLIRKSLISKTVVERREEFKRIIDKNQDGKADRGELLNYVNPKTPRYALQEAATLFSLCDENRDGKLTLKELIANAEIFLTSKMIDTAQSFHTEF
ncbi:45 kDa calcium-binding protein [Lucilia cuprina]|nr:45 kDa calcium-binding protein [Lucilia cuprina]KAI8124411.1 45 kDa calcium-binding protein [Lucilia cuprina]